VAARDWGIPLDKWFAIPTDARAMMMAIVEITHDIEALMIEKREAEIGRNPGTRSHSR
jgi:hypothetical protein